MGLLSRLFPGKTESALDRRRWVVLDVEASGLDPGRDRLLSIAALGLKLSHAQRTPEIEIADSFEVLLRQPADPGPTDDGVRENILIHGIGLAAQGSGLPAQQALHAFELFVGHSPLIAFHSSFDKTLIDRTMRAVLGRTLGNPWVDLEHVAAALFKQATRQSLDHWIRRFDIRCEARHQAMADTLATSEFLLKLWPQLQSRQQASWEGICNVAGEVQFMPGRY